MKIAFVVTSKSGTCGGMERVIAMLLRYFYDLGDDITVIFLHTKFYFECPGCVIELKERDYQTTWWGKVLSIFQVSYKLLKVLKKGKFDVIYNTYWPIPLLLYGYGFNFISAFHSNPFYLHKFKYIIKYFFAFSHVIVVPAQAVAKKMISDWGIKNVVAIGNPVDFNLIAECMNTEFEYESLMPYILTAGRLVREKNYHLLINAFSLSRAKDYLRLVIIGDGEKRGELQRLVDEKKLGSRISFLGTQSNPFVFMRNSLFFVSSSISESFSMVIIETLACGIPVISTNCLGPMEIIEHGKNGLIVENGNVQQLADAIDKLYFDSKLLEILKANARESVAKLSLEMICYQYRKLLSQYSVR